MSTRVKVKLKSADPARKPVVDRIILIWTPPQSIWSSRIQVRCMESAMRNTDKAQKLVADVDYTYKERVKTFRSSAAAQDADVLREFRSRQQELFKTFRARCREQLAEDPNWKKWNELVLREVRMRARQMARMELELVID
ncbi:hypothetical protein LTS08_007915 [Lithohypha guttulata]|uniref:Uncharacterized protein n=1 Tax=Lithohypha guttulata TaxID=1690604 RepID=A0AAN7PS76_9EURO|nr:hypothetical protein LTR05_008495 [Lithohypha guttulata]KAK5095780.1 hypothetical protein LTS08_007915 [Lithohypha guttulata]